MIKIRTMASNFEPLRALLTGDDGSLKVYRNIAPEGVKMPFLVWTAVSSKPLDSIDCAGKEADWSMQFDVYSKKQQECDDIAEEVINFINSFGRFKGYLNSPVILGEFRNTLSAFAIDLV